MASSLHTTNPNPQANIHLPEDHDHQQPVRRGAGRRKAKGTAANGQKKKQSQRGMGVARLELLRMQESAKNQNNVHGLNIYNPAAVSDQMNGNLVAKLGGGFGALNGQIGFNLNQSSSFGFPEQHMVNSSGLISNPFQMDPFGSVVGWNSKELSSTPKSSAAKCYYEQCNDCHKKKRVNGENIGCTMQMPHISNCDFLGLNVGENQSTNINQENHVGIRGPTVHRAGFSVPNSQPGVEVVALHRKGNSSSGSGSYMVMEYEFFPKRDGCNRSTVSNELMNLGSSSACNGSELSPSAADLHQGIRETEETAFDASTSIDLSLRLSYN